MTKILAIGDPHGALDKIRQIPFREINPDLILIPGDLGKSDISRRLAFEMVEREKQGLPLKRFSREVVNEAFNETYDSSLEILKHLSQFSPVYTIFGNIESTPHITYTKTKAHKTMRLTSNINSIQGTKVINNKLANTENLRIGGLEYFTEPFWVKRFMPKSIEMFRKRGYEEETEKAKRVLDNFGYTDILLCHQPPYGFLDKVDFPSAPKNWQGKHAGSKVILDYIKKYSPKLVLCGHIHEGKGRTKIGETEVVNLGCAGYSVFEFE